MGLIKGKDMPIVARGIAKKMKPKNLCKCGHERETHAREKITGYPMNYNECFKDISKKYQRYKGCPCKKFETKNHSPQDEVVTKKSPSPLPAGTLSDKIIPKTLIPLKMISTLYTTDVKEFIIQEHRLLIKLRAGKITWIEFWERRRKLAGKDLI